MREAVAVARLDTYLLNLTDPQVLRQLVRATSSKLLLAMEQNRELTVKTVELGQEVKQLAARADEQARLAGEMADERARELRAIPLSVWFSRTLSDHRRAPADRQ